MNGLPMVLCAGAICCAVEGRSHWVGPLLIIAALLAMAQNWINSKTLAIAMRKKLQ